MRISDWSSDVCSSDLGVVIGKKGADIEKLRQKLGQMARGSDVVLNIVEIRKPEIDATLVAENIAQQLERRVAFRRALKRSEGRRGGEEWFSTGRSRWCAYSEQNNRYTKKTTNN